MKIEQTILKELICSEQYARKVLPFLHSDYFQGVDAKVFEFISAFYTQYNTRPSLEGLAVDITAASGLTEKEVEDAGRILEFVKEHKDTSVNEQWLLDRTEKFCQERALYNAIIKSVNIIDGKEKHTEKGAIPTILTEALAVCFDSNVGHDYIEDSDDRYNYYHENVKRIPFDLEYMNKITNGGTPAKTLNIVMAGTGVGKTIFMCHHAAACLSNGFNVLYITLEISEEEISKRIDANLLDLRMEDLMLIPKADYDRRIGKLKEHVQNVGGRLIVKEYPTASVNVMHFRALLNELNLKKNFRPNIIFIDYLNLCLSSRVKFSGGINSYEYIKKIAEEMRGLAVEKQVPIWSATQLNRAGFSDSDPEMDQISESFGLPMTVDFMCILVSSDDLVSLNQVMVKQVKNRYRDVNKNRRFVLGLDKDKMRFEDVAESEQNLVFQKKETKSSGEEGEEEQPWKVEHASKEKFKNAKEFTY